MAKVREQTSLPVGQSELASYDWFGKFCPAVSKDEKTGCYQIRILKSKRWDAQRESTDYDYFELDKTGLITSSPRGRASEWNKKVRILNMDEKVEWAKDKYFNQ